MYLFHSHNNVGCLASIRDSGKMIHIPKEGTFVLLIVNRPTTISTVAFLFSSLIFLLCNITGEKVTAITARSYIHYQEKRVPKRTNKPIKNAVATATLGGHGQVSGSIHPMSSR